MRTGLLVLAILAGVLLRAAAVAWHDHPRGDVLLDTAVARQLVHLEGFRAGFERGTALVRGDGPVPPQDLADQHAPLWPLVGAMFAWEAGRVYLGLKLASLVAGLALLALTWRVADRLVESVPRHPDGVAELATALVALGFLMVEFSANGALYMAQACALLLLAEVLAAPRPSWLAAGLVLGSAWLLNHQAAVLLPVPLLVLVLAAQPGQRRRGVAVGLGALAVACALQAPWWWRNAQAFGDPFHSTNAFYPMHMAGVEPELQVLDGQPVARFPDVPLGEVLLRGLPRWLPGNVLYLVLAGLLLWPGVLALAASGLPRLVRAAFGGGDRRLATLLLGGALLAAVAVAWPGLKLRYLVPLTPVVVLLGVRTFASPPQPGEGRAAWVVVGAWLALLAGTAGDLGGERHVRWLVLAGGGLALLAVPLLLRHVRVRGVGLGLHVGLVTGLLPLPLLGAVALLPPPHTSYHGTALLPDIFGQPKDLLESRGMEALEQARRFALDAGARVVLGPEELLAWDRPRLVKLPFGGEGFADGPLAALVDAGRADHVLTPAEPPWPLDIPEGATWLDGRLEALRWVRVERDGQVLAAVLVSHVRR